MRFFLKKSSFKWGFTLLEILIFIALFAILAVAVFVLMDPFSQIKKANDAKRKKDLDTLKKAFEDYYNDKGCYPKPEEVCYPGTIRNVCEGGSTYTRKVRSKICFICGKEEKPIQFDNFKPYLDNLPCDPEHPRKKYVYEVEVKNCPFGDSLSNCQSVSCDSSNQCPSWYRIYTNLSFFWDKSSQDIGCLGSPCGLAPTPASTTQLLNPYNFNYGVSSPNISLERAPDFSCCNNLNRCNSCGSTYEECYAKHLSGKTCRNKDSISYFPDCNRKCPY